MKHCLLLLGVVAALAIGAPAYSQSVWMDVLTSGVGNGVCDVDDVITSTTTQVDVYVDTNHGLDGLEDFCTDGLNTLNMFSYDVIIVSTGSLDLSTATWTNQVSAFPNVLDAVKKSTNAFSCGFVAPLGTTLAAGPYKLGTLNFTASGSPTLAFTSDPTPLPGGAQVTGFGSDCFQVNGKDSDFPNTVSLGHDFTDACGTASGTPTNTTTWGAIKNLYK